MAMFGATARRSPCGEKRGKKHFYGRNQSKTVVILVRLMSFNASVARRERAAKAEL